ncbi:MAG: mandelate racemase/muconate lactonizing enzyme family protein [Nitrospinota bacterium]
MKVERADVIPIAIPLKHPYKDATRMETHSRDVLLKITTDAGATGWGAAAARSHPTGETQAGAAAVLREVLVPRLLGQDPFRREALMTSLEEAIPFHYAAKAAVDIALHDLVGKLLGRPAYDLLGGLVREAMPAFDILPLEAPERTAELAREAMAGGLRAFKVKMNQDVSTSVRRVAKVREAVGEGVMLVVDANMSWRPKQAVAACRELVPYGVEMVEQPVPLQDLEGLAYVARESPLPIGADESMRPDYVGELVRRRAADVASVKVNREGGLLACKKVAAVLESANILVLCGSVVHTSLIDAAAAHFFASTPAVAYNESGKGPAWHAADICTGLEVREGMVRVPQGPGLGVEVDEEAVERFRVR